MNYSSRPGAVLVTVPDACRRVGVGRTTIYGLARDGRITMLKAGRKTLIPVESLDAFVSSLPRLHADAL